MISPAGQPAMMAVGMAMVETAKASKEAAV